jgi:hypothetical protein
MVSTPLFHLFISYSPSISSIPTGERPGTRPSRSVLLGLTVLKMLQLSKSSEHGKLCEHKGSARVRDYLYDISVLELLVSGQDDCADMGFSRHKLSCLFRIALDLELITPLPTSRNIL